MTDSTIHVKQTIYLTWPKHSDSIYNKSTPLIKAIDQVLVYH